MSKEASPTPPSTDTSVAGRRAPPLYDFTIVLLEGGFPTCATVTVDMLVTAERLAPRLGVVPPRWRVCSANGGTLHLRHGISMTTTRLPARSAGDTSVWVAPGLGIERAQDLDAAFATPQAVATVKALKRHAQAGGEVAASCSAVFLLQAAGLLAGKRVTTAWWLASALAKLEPTCEVDAQRMVCNDGAVTTAGAALGQTDLMLHLLRNRCGNALAEAVARVLLIDGREAQSSYAFPPVFAIGDELVAKLTARIEAALPNVPSVTELAKAFCMSEKTLSRHVRRVTGKSSLALVQSVRNRRARALLMSSRMNVEQIAAAVGYQDATSLRRLMRKFAGANPSRFRPAVALP